MNSVNGCRFDESCISPLTLKALSASGILKMTRVQDATLSECLDGLCSSSSFGSNGLHLTTYYPICNAGKDALVKAKTGTGKSMAFLVFYNPFS